MKFVCDNCQAKYQIGDEKVAGKTVRMKCRRCGNEIRVRAAEGEHPHADLPIGEIESMSAIGVQLAPPSGVLHGPPPSIHQASHPALRTIPGVAPGAHAPPPPAPQPPQRTLPGVVPPRPGAAGPPRPGTAPPGMLHAPLPHAPHPPPHAPHPVAHAAPHAVSHAAAHAVAHAPRPATAHAPASQARPAVHAPAPRPHAPPAHAPAGHVPHPPRPVSRTASSSSLPVVSLHDEHARGPGLDDDESTSILQGPVPSYGHLRPVDAAPRRPSQVPPPPAPAADHEWYVGIRGTPTGPIRGPEIRARAAAGDIDADSLVWREGQAEWRPLKTVPELTALLAPPTPAPALAAVLTPGPIPAVPLAPPPVALRAPTPAPAPAAPAPVSAPQAWAGSVVPVEPPKPEPAKVEPTKPEPPKPEPARAEPAKPEPARAEPAKAHGHENDLDLVLGRSRKPTHPMAYAFVAAAAAFGGVAAWALISRPTAAPTERIVIVQAPAATGPAATPSSDPDKAQVDVGEISTASPQGPAVRPGSGGTRPKGSAAPSSSTSAPIDVSGFQQNVPGPSAQGPSNAQTGGGGQLSTGEITAVVSQNQPLVKRKCWQPALEARAANAPTTARVMGTISIGPSGAVESASASGAESSYPGLSACIQQRMKGWKFPPSGGSQTVQVPFVFAGQ
jgi:predicted Zn finger-like uncharacterized protein